MVRGACVGVWLVAALPNAGCTRKQRTETEAYSRGHHDEDEHESESAGGGPGVGISALATCSDPAVCGQKSGLIKFPKDAIHSSLVWKKHADCPKLLMWMRPSEYKPSDFIEPLPPGMGFPGLGTGFRDSYLDFVQARYFDPNTPKRGYNLSMLDESGWSRHASDLGRENTQLVDVCGLMALIDTGVFTKHGIADLDAADMSLTDPYFTDAGHSRGLGQNLFCAGNVSGIDGRVIVIGGHNMAGNNGLRKMTVFDPETERWLPLPTPCVRSGFTADPNGLDPGAHCNPLVETNSDPPHSSDLAFQRWYPSGVTLPDGRILVLSGTDQDISNPALASRTKQRPPFPEVWDPITQRTTVLWNAKKKFPMYVRSFVTQTGPGKDDWKVCTTAEITTPLPRNAMPPEEAGDGANITGYDPWRYAGKTYCLDVLAALADPNRDVEASNHWEFIGNSLNAHNSGAGVRMVTIHSDGTHAQRVFLFGGNNGSGGGGSSNVAETIDLSAATPTYQSMDNLDIGTTQNNAVALPNGKLLVVGGNDSFNYQLYDPATGSRTNVASSVVPRHDHSTALVMPDGSVWVMGGNRIELICDGAGAGEDDCDNQEIRNAAVAVLEVYKPSYFFQGARPVISKAPKQIHHGQQFTLDLAPGGKQIVAVTLLRTGPITHNWAWTNHSLKLPVTYRSNGKVEIQAPRLPALAVAGDYMLFALDEDGVPSLGKHVRLLLEDDED
jgi:hypothetical protein